MDQLRLPARSSRRSSARESGDSTEMRFGDEDEPGGEKTRQNVFCFNHSDIKAATRDQFSCFFQEFDKFVKYLLNIKYIF